mmetsp:Transcript_40369/g.101001  ORF Transcript_40369/g.101001 Transcript_40369/m.101001 type:complete len:258 (+) Transcript_40369:454-1227(+)
MLLVTLWEEFDRGEALDVQTQYVVCCGVHVCDEDALDGAHLLRHGLVHTAELLAVTAPWCVEEDEHVLLGLHDHIIERLANHSVYRPWLFCWDDFAPQKGAQVGRFEIINEFEYSLPCDGFVHFVLDHVGRGVLEQHQSGCLLEADADVVEEAQLYRVRHTHDSHQHPPLELLGRVVKRLFGLPPLVILLANHHQDGLARTKQLWGDITCEFVDKGHLVLTNKLKHSLRVVEVTLELDLPLVKGLDEQQTGHLRLVV